jgi:hypothetical protein
MFDCVNKKSELKEESYNYDYIIKTSQNIEDAEIDISDNENNYELSLNGICPKDCKHCYENKKCIKCRDNFKFVGSKKNQEITCLSQTELSKGYYLENDIYYSCISNCDSCSDDTTCTTCSDGYGFINNKCIERNTSTYEIGAFYYYVCDGDININNFPTLYFKSKNLQYIFQLTKDDIFIKVKNKIYFLIIFEFSRTNTWVLGKPFLNKYLFSYNYDAKTISFYNENLLEESENNNNNNDNNNNKKYIILFIIIVLSLIALVLGFIIGRYIYYKRKNKRALELDESLNNNYIDEEGKNKEKKDISIN